MEKPEILLFTDGSCPKNPGPGGWAYILRMKKTGTEKQDSGGEIQTTNNRMELQAVIEPLKLLEFKPCSIILCSDSQYVTKEFQNGCINGNKRAGRSGMRTR